MELVCTRSEDDVDNATGVAAAFGTGLSLRGKFVNRIQGHDSAGDARHTALIDRGNVVPEIVVVDAVNLQVHLVGAGSVQRAVPATRSAPGYEPPAAALRHGAPRLSDA